MNESKLATLEQIGEFLAGTSDVAFAIPAEEPRLHAFAKVLQRFRYFSRPQRAAGFLFEYMQRLSGYSRQHLSRLIAQYRDTHSIAPATRARPPYLKNRLVWRGTRPSAVPIGIRKALAPQGLPGYIRIDTVHRGD